MAALYRSGDGLLTDWRSAFGALHRVRTLREVLFCSRGLGVAKSRWS